MTVQTVKLGGKKFVIVPEKDYRRLQQKAEETEPKPASRRRLTAQDQGDIAEATRRLNDPKEKPIPYAQVRKELGIA